MAAETDDKTGDAVPEEETKVRTMFITYEAGDDAADTFMILVGMVAENFQGVKLVEFQDDTVFAEGTDAMALLHRMTTEEGRLTDDQRQTLEEFAQQLSAWEGGESP